MKLRKLALTLAAAVLLLAQADTTLQRAIRKETMEGDLKGAIELYQKAIGQAGKDRATAAQALLRLGDCYEKQGDKQARQAYERLVKEFGDSKEASQARVKLAALGGGSAVTTAMVWQGGWPSRGIASDQPLVVHGSDRTNDLMLLNLVTGETRNLTNLSPGTKERAWDGRISADGKTVVYRWDSAAGNKQEIRSIASDGTGLHTLYSGKMAPSISPQTLSPDKRTLLVSTAIEKSGSTPAHRILQAMSLADGSLKPFADGFWGGQVNFSPDGKLVALAGRMAPGIAGSGRLFLANADGTGLRTLLPEPVGDPCWTADGKWIVFISERTGTAALWALPPTGGEPRFLKEVSDIQSLIGLMRDGSLFYTSETNLSDVQVARLDPTNFAVAGTPVPLVATYVGRNERLAFSPDGKWVAWRSTRGTEYVLVIRPTAGGEERVIYKVGGLFDWFPDSQALLIHREGGMESVLDRISVADGRVSELDWGVFGPGLPALTAPNGRTLLWARCDAAKGCDLARIDTRTKAETVEHLDGMVERGPMALSPDGKWLAILGKSPSKETLSLFVRPAAPGGKLVELVQGVEMVRGAYTFTFTPDSQAILYTVSLPAPRWHEFRVIPVEGGTPISIPLAGEFPSFHPDGRLAYTRSSDAVETWVVRNLPLK